MSQVKVITSSCYCEFSNKVFEGGEIVDTSCFSDAELAQKIAGNFLELVEEVEQPEQTIKETKKGTK